VGTFVPVCPIHLLSRYEVSDFDLKDGWRNLSRAFVQKLKLGGAVAHP
jgi:hypothetical protein